MMDGVRQGIGCGKFLLSSRHVDLKTVLYSTFGLVLRSKQIIAVAVASVLVGFLAIIPGLTVQADDGSELPIQYCLSCHVQELEIHDRLGPKNEACWSCHDKSDMSMLHLANGEPLPLSESSTLCGQCHQERFNSWQEGTHGVPGTIVDVPCSSCHDPHMPAVILADITIPHSPPAPAPLSPPSSDILIIVGVSLGVLVVLGVVVGRRGGSASNK